MPADGERALRAEIALLLGMPEGSGSSATRRLPSPFAVGTLAGRRRRGVRRRGRRPARGAPTSVVHRTGCAMWFRLSLIRRTAGRRRRRGTRSPATTARADGWIRLHTNAPAHRAAALRVLGVPGRAGGRRGGRRRLRGRRARGRRRRGGRLRGAHAHRRRVGRAPAGRSVLAEPLIASPHRVRRGSRSSSPGRPTGRWPGCACSTSPACSPDRSRRGSSPLLGADVLRIDPPGWDEPGVIPEVMLGKRTARLDLATRRPGALAELLAGADVLVHGYRPGALEHLGLGGRRAAAHPARASSTSASTPTAGRVPGRAGAGSTASCR